MSEDTATTTTTSSSSNTSTTTTNTNVYQNGMNGTHHSSSSNTNTNNSNNISTNNHVNNNNNSNNNNNNSNVNSNNNNNNNLNPFELLMKLNGNLEVFIQSLISSNEAKEKTYSEVIEVNIENLLGSIGDLDGYLKSIQSKYNQKKDLDVKQEIFRVKKEIESKDMLIEKYKNKVKEWKSHFEPIYREQYETLNSSGQVFSSSSDIPFSPMQTPIPNTPSILSSLSQRTPPAFNLPGSSFL
ncbi:putative mediator complex subunit 28 [Heterostelium album PN500]|uniref:Putative mediator complex subunit 28 n=1 Tax=Heterostelium pallidum (strain ATCC 26659 / Pp 5 / PN500) TaxID=670386 RepID=D3B9T3_HETP5|nr:putative mediator complex subunit 28 [Heterostelium album PN500]EFA81995.1 putative mediator complex subunit 28 [Heterostelium album PN500]|eukprot:XP_020434112.1 putative mediator complex subunit 28 [Heterostelium album PN500]